MVQIIGLTLSLIQLIRLILGKEKVLQQQVINLEHGLQIMEEVYRLFGGQVLVLHLVQVLGPGVLVTLVLQLVQQLLYQEQLIQHGISLAFNQRLAMWQPRLSIGVMRMSQLGVKGITMPINWRMEPQTIFLGLVTGDLMLETILGILYLQL